MLHDRVHPHAEDFMMWRLEAFVMGCGYYTIALIIIQAVRCLYSKYGGQ